ncbi:hypothetical protein IG631_15335 [Alternaria alternata]|nr:hypothetical protein IG631_15335 [Alternaria alternata]
MICSSCLPLNLGSRPARRDATSDAPNFRAYPLGTGCGRKVAIQILQSSSPGAVAEGIADVE